MTDETDERAHWRAFRTRRARLSPPLGVDPDAVSAIAACLGEKAECLLVLGATPELGLLSGALTMVDWSDAMVESVWRPAWPDSRMACADWRNWESAVRFTGVCGDGSLSALAWPQDYRTTLANVAHLLEPGGRVAIRLFLAPDEPETLAAIAAAARAGKAGGFHALKWRIAHAIAAEQGHPNVAVADIRAAFDRLFPDRAALRAANDWPEGRIDEIDAYAASPLVYSFPTQAELRDAIPEGFGTVRLVPSGRYELAERCPILSMTRTR